MCVEECERDGELGEECGACALQYPTHGTILARSSSLTVYIEQERGEWHTHFPIVVFHSKPMLCVCGGP